MRFLRWALLGLVCAATAGEKTDIVIGSEFVMNSAVLKQERTIRVSVPQAYNVSTSSYPVLYVTDADTQFEHTVAVTRFLSQNQRIPPVIVVGILHQNRVHDLTPTDPDGTKIAGGADNFLGFLETELVPKIEKEYRTAPFRIFAGHSLGGLFAVHAFLSKPDLFQATIAVSPSLWWDKQGTVNKAESFFKNQDPMKRSLYITLGNEREDMLAGFKRMEGVLQAQKKPDFRWLCTLMPREDHGSVVLKSHYDGLEFIFDGWSFPEEVQSLAQIRAHMKKISDRLGFEVPLHENLINNLGYAALARNNHQQAIELFTENTKLFPESANVYDSLGEAYEKAGKLKEALRFYEQASTVAEKIQDPRKDLYKANFERLKKQQAQL